MVATPSVPGAVNVAAASLTGSEIVAIAASGPQSTQTTTGAIAGLAASSSTASVVTTLTTVGAGTITAAGIVGRVTLRTGPVAAFTDTTATAALIVAALPSGAPTGASFRYTYINNTNFAATIASGSGAVMKDIAGATASVTVPANSIGEFLVTRTSSTVVTFREIVQSFFVNTSGTFVANGATPVTVANAAFGGKSNVIFTLNTVGGTVGAYPSIKTVTPGTGFTVACTASDTSTYAYLILG